MIRMAPGNYGFESVSNAHFEDAISKVDLGRMIVAAND